MRTSILVMFLAVAAALAVAQEKKPSKPLPPNAAAMVHGKVITLDRFKAALLRRFGATEDGQEILENLAVEILVKAEAKRRGVTVGDDEVRKYIKKTEDDINMRSAGKRTLDDFLRERGVTRDGFMEIARDFLLRQKLAAQDFRSEGELSGARLGVWIEDLKRKGNIQYGPKGLPERAWARAGDELIEAKEYGEALIKGLAASRLESALWDLVLSEAIDQKLREWKIEITAADVDAAIALLDQDFRSDPRFKGIKVTFEQYVATVRQMTVAELRKDAAFLAQVGLTKKIGLDLTEAEVKKYFEENAERYGERRSFLHLLVKGEAKATPFGKVARPMVEAKRIIEGYRKEYLAGTPFEELVKKHSEARTRTIKPETPIVVHRRSTLPAVLRDIVFGATVGDVIGPVRTSYGYHLVKVLKVIPAPPYEKAKDQVRQDLIKTKQRSALLAIRKDPGIILRF